MNTFYCSNISSGKHVNDVNVALLIAQKIVKAYFIVIKGRMRYYILRYTLEW